MPAKSAEEDIDERRVGVVVPDDKADKPGEAGVVGGGCGPGGVSEGEACDVVGLDLSSCLAFARSCEKKLKPPMVVRLLLRPSVTGVSVPAVVGSSDADPTLTAVGAEARESKNDGMLSVRSSLTSLSFRARMPTMSTGIMRSPSWPSDDASAVAEDSGPVLLRLLDGLEEVGPFRRLVVCEVPKRNILKNSRAAGGSWPSALPFAGCPWPSPAKRPFLRD